MVAISPSGAAELTAYATLGLGVFTVVLAIAAIGAAIAAAKSLREARTSTDIAKKMAERQIEATRRPLLIDVPIAGPIDPNERLIPNRSDPRVLVRFGDGFEEEADPRQICVRRRSERLYIAVPLRNIGTGVAVLAPPFSILALGPWVPETSFPRTERRFVPPGETTRISCVARIHGEPDSYPWVVTVSAVYHDFLHRQESVITVYLEQSEMNGEWTLLDIARYMSDAPDDLDRYLGSLSPLGHSSLQLDD
jgi:hypothetical protein